MGSKLLYRFRSGTHGLNEQLGRHTCTFIVLGTIAELVFFVAVITSL